MATKTCIQKHMSSRTSTMVTSRRPHEPEQPDGTESGYSPCIHCGARVYVGQGELSPQAGQLREHLANRADMLR